MSRAYLYALACDGFHKIGISTSPSDRICDFERLIPYAVTLTACRLFQSRGQALAIEQALHVRLAASRVRSEWYRLPADDLAFAIGVIEGREAIEPLSWSRACALAHLARAPQHMPTAKRTGTRRYLTAKKLREVRS